MSSLAQKLEHDNLRSVCQRSVEELHGYFVAWFQGTQDREGLSTQLLACLAPDFSHVAPNGQFLQGRSILLSHLQDKYGCYQNRLFQIEIYNVQLLWSDPNGDKCLCTYEEWQSWLPEKDSPSEEDDDDDDDDSDPSMEPPQATTPDEVHQFGRLSTCLLERKRDAPTDGSGHYRWIHVHETWLEAESPQHERSLGMAENNDAKSSYLEEETIMTGPVEYHKMIADRQPPTASSMLDPNANSSQEEDDDEDHVLHDKEDDDEDSSEASSSDEDEEEGPLKAPPSSDDEESEEGPMPAAAAAAVAGVLQSTATARNIDNDNDSEDDDDDEDSPFDRHLLMLMSNQALSRDQVSRQNEARNILESSGIAFYELDGANPEERENRNSLFALSGKWGVYPMFFLVDTAGSTTYWGDFDKFQASHAAGTLEDDINQPDDTEDEETETESSMPPLPPVAVEAAKESRSSSPPPSVSAASDSSSSDAEETPEEAPRTAETVATATPAATMIDPENMPEKATNCRLILLMSSQTLSRDQKTHQEEAARVLAQYDIPHVVVDGSVKQNRERRNQLFRCSTYWGKYFQLFHEDTNKGTLTYWGAWEELETSMVRNTVERDLQYMTLPPAPLEGPEVSPEATARAPTNAAASSSSDGSESSESNAKPAVAAATAAAVASTAAAANALAKSPTGFEKNVILLLSNQSLSRDQMNRQAHAREYMESVDYTELDGAAKENRQTRNELFKISKLWGRYPQVFVIKPDTSDPIFFADWEKIETLHENGTLEKEIAALVGPEEDSSDSESESEESLNIEEGLQSTMPNGVPATTGSQSAMQNSGSSRLNVGDKKVIDLDPNSAEPKSQEELFLERSSGILQFEDEGSDDEKKSSPKDDGVDSMTEEERLKQVTSTLSPIPQDASSKRHVSSKLLKHAKPLTWANTLVGLSINGFDIGTSQGPLADELWYKEVTEALEIVSQYKRPGAVHGRRKLALPETVYPTAHVALEGHGYWLSWDVLDAMEEWARAHSEIEVMSSSKNKGVSVMKSVDGKKFWENKKTLQNTSSGSSLCHFDWTYSTPFPGKVEGGSWTELDESGMRAELLTDTSVPILFFDDVTMFHDNLQNYGQVEYSAKLRVMPSCAYVLARLYVVVDHVVVRVRESRLLVDFFGLKPAIYRDVTWRECAWRDLKSVGLSTDPKTLHFDGKENADWQSMLRKIPEVDPPKGVMRYAVLEAPAQGSKKAAALTPSRGAGDDGSLGYLEV